MLYKYWYMPFTLSGNSVFSYLPSKHNGTYHGERQSEFSRNVDDYSRGCAVLCDKLLGDASVVPHWSTFQSAWRKTETVNLTL